MNSVRLQWTVAAHYIWCRYWVPDLLNCFIEGPIAAFFLSTMRFKCRNTTVFRFGVEFIISLINERQDNVVVLSPDQRTLWAANALSSSISSFDIDRDGSARLKNVTSFKSDPELLFFSDMAVSDDGRNLFQLVGNRGEVMVFDIDRNGDLSLNQTLKGLPKLGVYGLLVL